MDVWLGINKHKENPLNTIKRTVESVYKKEDSLRVHSSLCMYRSFLFVSDITRHKKYVFDKFFTKMGIFPDTLGRRYFIFALLDNCDYERVCPKCTGRYHDILQHTLSECSKVAHLRLLLKCKLKFYNIPANICITDKRQLFLLALFGKRVFRNIHVSI